MTRYSAYPHVLCLATALAGAIALAGCGGNNEKKASQSIARIDDYEITVLQLNGELKNIGRAPGADAAKLQKQALESLIDRQLLVAEAQREKLDRDPEVMQAIETSKSQIVAQALLRRKLAAIPKPSQSEIDDYYQKNPELFTNRKLFEMRQLSVAAGDYSDDAKRVLDGAKNIDEFAAWLDSQKIRYSKGAATRTTADLPPQIIANLDTLAKGRPFLLKDSERIAISSLVYLKDTPVSAAEATPQIAQFLINQKTREAVNSEISRLRANAKIEYMANAPGAKADAPAAPANTNDKPVNHIAKGVSGLK